MSITGCGSVPCHLYSGGTGPRLKEQPLSETSLVSGESQGRGSRPLQRFLKPLLESGYFHSQFIGQSKPYRKFIR